MISSRKYRKGSFFREKSPPEAAPHGAESFYDTSVLKGLFFCEKFPPEAAPHGAESFYDT